MGTLTEDTRAGEYIKSDQGDYSRDNIIVKDGENLKAGAVLAAEVSATATGAMNSGNTGNGTIGTVSAGNLAKPGVYEINIVEADTDAGRFEVIDPDGNACGEGNVGTAFDNNEVAFTIADGDTDFIVGDGATVTVSALTKKYIEIDFSATDGTEVAQGILYSAIDASATGYDADTKGVATVRSSEVVEDRLEWPTGATAGQKALGIAHLEALGIIVRS